MKKKQLLLLCAGAASTFILCHSDQAFAAEQTTTKTPEVTVAADQETTPVGSEAPNQETTIPEASIDTDGITESTGKDDAVETIGTAETNNGQVTENTDGDSEAVAPATDTAVTGDTTAEGKGTIPAPTENGTTGKTDTSSTEGTQETSVSTDSQTVPTDDGTTTKDDETFTTRVQGEDFVASTGNVYVRHDGESIPVSASNDDGSFKLNGADGGAFVDMSDPIADTSTYENTIPEGQDTVTYEVDVPEDGTYQFTFHYNNPGTQMGGNRNDRDERNCRIVVNNPDDFLSDDGWAGWMIFSISGYNDSDATEDTPQTKENIEKNTAWNKNIMNIRLKQGKNLVTLGIQAPPGQAVFDGPNLDYFDVTYIQDQYVDASEIPYVSDDYEFQHPGIYYTMDDLNRIKENKDDLSTVEGKGYQEIKESSTGSADYQPQAVETIDVGPYNNPNIGGTEYTVDGEAAQYNALEWYMDGDVSHAKAAIRVLNSWADTLKNVADGNDLKLRFALVGPDFLNAAEILKYVYNNDPSVASEDKWQQSDMDKFEEFLRTKLLAKTYDYYPQANGNWDASIGAFNMAAAVYLNDTKLFNDALTQFYRGDLLDGSCSSMGSINNYIYTTGEAQESNRDQTHGRMGISGLAYQSEIAWNQGIDIFSAYNNRLLAGTLYSSKYMTGETVPSETFISAKNRGIPDVSSMVYEIVSNHYMNEINSDVSIDVIRQAAKETMEEADVKNEAKQSASYYGAMAFQSSPVQTEENKQPIEITVSGESLKNVGDKVVYTADVNLVTAQKGVRWNISSDLLPYVQLTKNGNQLTVELVKKPEGELAGKVTAVSMKSLLYSATAELNAGQKVSTTDVIVPSLPGSKGSQVVTLSAPSSKAKAAPVSAAQSRAQENNSKNLPQMGEKQHLLASVSGAILVAMAGFLAIFKKIENN